MRPARPATGIIFDQRDAPDPTLTMRTHADEAKPVCTCGKSKRADVKPLSKERAATDALRARMARQWQTTGDA